MRRGRGPSLRRRGRSRGGRIRGCPRRGLAGRADEEQAPYAYISDLVVLPAHRQRGIGRALLDRAEGFACDKGARMLRVAVLARNRPAGELYRSVGFAEYVIQFSKMLSPPREP